MSGDHFLQIGGITIAVRCSDERVRWQWSAAARRFLTPVIPREVGGPGGAAGTIGAQSGPPGPSTSRGMTRDHIEIAVGVLDSSLPPAGELIFDSDAVWRMYRDDGGYRIDCSSDELGDGPYKIARFDSSFTRGEVLMRAGVLSRELNPLDYPLDELLMVNLLGRNRGVELHSCGVIDAEGRGHLFVGMSGAGKSTTAHLWEGASRGIVSDDRVIVREQDGAMWMYGTPWHGEAELSLAARVPLVDVYLLVQAPANEIRALPAVAAVARLFGCSFPPFYDAASVDYTLGLLERLVATVPVRELHFTRDRSVVDLVLAA